MCLSGSFDVNLEIVTIFTAQINIFNCETEHKESTKGHSAYYI